MTLGSTTNKTVKRGVTREKKLEYATDAFLPTNASAEDEIEAIHQAMHKFDNHTAN